MGRNEVGKVRGLPVFGTFAQELRMWPFFKYVLDTVFRILIIGFERRFNVKHCSCPDVLLAL